MTILSIRKYICISLYLIKLTLLVLIAQNKMEEWFLIFLGGNIRNKLDFLSCSLPSASQNSFLSFADISLAGSDGDQKTNQLSWDELNKICVLSKATHNMSEVHKNS